MLTGLPSPASCAEQQWHSQYSWGFEKFRSYASLQVTHLCGEYKLGMGRGRLRVWDRQAITTPRMASTTAAAFKPECMYFLPSLHGPNSS